LPEGFFKKAVLVRSDSGSFLDLAGTNAPRTNGHLQGLAVTDNPDVLDVGIRYFFVLVMGMADIIPYQPSFAANLTFS
jgi:hypothetical protein